MRVAASLEAAHLVKHGTGHAVTSTKRWSASRSIVSSPRPRSSSAGVATPSEKRRTRTSARSASDCPARSRDQSASRRARPEDRHGAQLHGAALDLPPQELLYPTCRRTTRSASTTSRSTSGASWSWSTVARRHRTGSHGGGHGQDDPCRRRRPHPRGRLLARDYNRAGVPLVEIVSVRTSPRRPKPARTSTSCARSSCHGGIRRPDGGGLPTGRRERLCAPAGAAEYGTRCEVKNLNSLRSLERAIGYEVARQIALLESGERVAQETRHWDEGDGRTMRCAPRKRRTTTVTFRARSRTARAGRASPRGGRRGCRPHAGRAPPPLSELLKAGPEPAERRDGSTTDQVVTVVDLGLDELVHGAVTAGADPHLSLRAAANEAAATRTPRSCSIRSRSRRCSRWSRPVSSRRPVQGSARRAHDPRGDRPDRCEPGL